MAEVDNIADGFEALEVFPPASPPANAAKIVFGKVIPPQQQILLYSPSEWEAFIHEWAESKKPDYHKVVRLSGAADMGVDVAGLVSEAGFHGVWDNFQCKHYDSALTPSIALPEIGKMLWHSFNGEFVAPRTYYFMAPKGCGISLQRLLLNAGNLREALFEKWDDWCAPKVTTKEAILLTGKFLVHCETFDYSIFGFRAALEVIDEHRHTPYFAARFGGGLPDRPSASQPPAEPASDESRYLQQLFEAYSDKKRNTLRQLDDLASWPDLTGHYHRQRESFYHAESLRNFARDTVPPGTFESLQDEVYAGVVDVSEAKHDDAVERLNAVAQAATNLPLTESGLITVVKVQDRRGICHQLANVDRLVWKK